MTSIVIAAHNEESVIGRNLDALLSDADPGEFDVVVVANGCTDRTSEVAAARAGVRVIDMAVAGKSNALNVGDQAASGFPRVYLDADIVVNANLVRTVTAPLSTPIGPSARAVAHLAAVPGRRLDLEGRPLLVRGYFAIHSRLPVYRTGLFGRGMIALSQQGRDRFTEFPEMIADDLFLDSLFRPEEKHHVDSVSTLVATPRSTRHLVRRLVRVRRGNAEMRAAGRSGEVHAVVRPADRLAWLRDVVVLNPRLIPAAFAYVGITITAAVLARRRPSASLAWGRDDSTRAPKGPDGKDGSRG